MAWRGLTILNYNHRAKKQENSAYPLNHICFLDKCVCVISDKISGSFSSKIEYFHMVTSFTYKKLRWCNDANFGSRLTFPD